MSASLALEDPKFRTFLHDACASGSSLFDSSAAYVYWHNPLPSDSFSSTLHPAQHALWAIAILEQELIGRRPHGRGIDFVDIRSEWVGNWLNVWRWASFLLRTYILTSQLSETLTVDSLSLQDEILYIVPGALCTLLTNSTFFQDTALIVAGLTWRNTSDNLLSMSVETWLHCMEHFHPSVLIWGGAIAGFLKESNSVESILFRIKETICRPPNAFETIFRYMATLVQKDQIAVQELWNCLSILQSFYLKFDEEPFLSIMERN
ncbi:hypothetical protein VKT23_013599 [Stygiomarasmius scandens]|uniref:Uncharacterized protein n=1 Tax=Marasmiellus scandens TaxID=2682957 RepID=A0ABR1J3G8_9AGAR